MFANQCVTGWEYRSLGKCESPRTWITAGHQPDICYKSHKFCKLSRSRLLINHVFVISADILDTLEKSKFHCPGE